MSEVKAFSHSSLIDDRYWCDVKDKNLLIAEFKEIISSYIFRSIVLVVFILGFSTRVIDFNTEIGIITIIRGSVS